MPHMLRPEKFWDRIAKRYAALPVSNETTYQKKLEITRAYFAPNSEVLEFGCGTGEIAISHAPFVQHIHAIDVSPKMLEFAQAKVEVADIINVTFVCANIEAFSQNNATYDVIMGHNILHLLEDKETVLAKVYDMLKPGGVFISDTACMSGQKAFMRIGLAVASRLGLFVRVQFFSIKNLVQSLNNAGFTIDQQWQPKNADTVFIVAKKPCCNEVAEPG